METSDLALSSEGLFFIESVFVPVFKISRFIFYVDNHIYSRICFTYVNIHMRVNMYFTSNVFVGQMSMLVEQWEPG